MSGWSQRGRRRKGARISGSLGLTSRVPVKGVGRHADRNYCACGAKKKQGRCPRCPA